MGDKTAASTYRQAWHTGWAQTCYLYGASEEDALRKLEYDLYYIKQRGPLLDLVILFRTIGVMFGFRGR